MAGRADVFCRFAGGRGPKSAGPLPVVGDESGRNRFFAAARCASWDSGVVRPSGGTLLGPALRGEEGFRSRMEMGASSSAPRCFSGVEVVCENGVGINTYHDSGVRVIRVARDLGVPSPT